jgi:hypothetical protein
MDQIPVSPYKIPRNAYQRELSCLDPALFKPIPPALQPIWPLLKVIYRRAAPKEPERAAPASEPKSPESPCMDFDEACAYLRLTERQLRDLCRDQRITHFYRTYRFKKSDLDE